MNVREKVVRAAVRLFAEKGFEATTVREIVEEAGVTKGGLYHYFESKDDLLFEIYTAMLRMQTRRMVTIAESDLPLPERLHAIIADVVVTSIADLDAATVFFLSFPLLEKSKQVQVRAERRTYHERVRDLVTEGQRTGVFREDVPADLVINYHFGAIHRLGMWYHADGSLSGEQVGEHFANLMLRSLRP
ncbi:TetR/AcrR family transcriptional regulator [Amycolatopsis sp. NPDC051061]|uniref:TetR/AcrR family transcriptional regulator n=1 Tax=Amycolatopsis sp. NPDC051061 TaxID=3155042 RepID=UPI003432E01F